MGSQPLINTYKELNTSSSLKASRASLILRSTLWNGRKSLAQNLQEHIPSAHNNHKLITNGWPQNGGLKQAAECLGFRAFSRPENRDNAPNSGQMANLPRICSKFWISHKILRVLPYEKIGAQRIMAVFQEYLDNLPLFWSQSAPIFQILLRILPDFVPILLRFCPKTACPDLNFPWLKSLFKYKVYL